MTSNIGRSQVIAIYKSLMKESQKFPSYNFRSYALRRVRDAFKENKNLTDNKLIKKEYDFAVENLAIVKRQVAIGSMYKSEKLVIENIQ